MRPVIPGHGRAMGSYSNVGARISFGGANGSNQNVWANSNAGGTWARGSGRGTWNVNHGNVAMGSNAVGRLDWQNPNDLQNILCWNCGGRGHIAACCGSVGGRMVQYALKRCHIDVPARQSQISTAAIKEITDEVGDQNDASVGIDGKDGYIEEDEFAALDDKNMEFIEVDDLDNMNASGVSWVWALSSEPKTFENSEKANLYDSGASRHISPFKVQFETYCCIPPYPIKVASKHILNTVSISSININVPNGTKVTRISLTDVLHVPGICMMIVSISRMLEAGYESHFQEHQCVITGRRGRPVLGRIPVGRGGLFKAKHAYAFCHG